MRILILTDQIENGGGAGVVAMNHARALAARGNEVTVITTTQEKGGVVVKKVEGITIHSLYSNYPSGMRAYVSLNNRSIVKKVGKIMTQLKPDIIHVHNIHLYLSYAILSESQKHTRAIFITIHDSMPFHYSKLFPSLVKMDGDKVINYKVSPFGQLWHFGKQYNPFRNRIIKKYLKIPTKIFAVSGALAQALADNGIKNVEVLHNGINVDEWKPTVSAEISDKDYIFFGGRLSGVKGGGVLVDALKNVLHVRPNTRLFVVGEKNQFAEQMEAEAKEITEIEGVIIFTGKLPYSEMKNMYVGVAMVAVPSLCFDWFPTVILEAMASKKPVIATCFGGAKELVVDGKTGFIINPYRIEELTAAILKLLNDRKLANDFAEAGYELVKNKFSMEKHMSKLIEWYDKALKS